MVGRFAVRFVVFVFSGALLGLLLGLVLVALTDRFDNPFSFMAVGIGIAAAALVFEQVRAESTRSDDDA